MILTGRATLITGASGGLGSATAKAIAQAGADVCIGYFENKADAEAARAAVEALGRRSAIVQVDQTNAGSVESAVADTVQQLGGLDILINNAAVNFAVPFADLAALTPEIWDRLMNTNLRGPFLMARAAAPHLRKRHAGRIVNVAAMIGLLPTGSSIAQAVSKAALIHLTRCLAVALGPDVLVNCVAPGLMEGTRMAARVPAARVDAMRQQAILKRNTRIEDVANQIVQFCEAESITGQVLVIDGGIHFH